MSKRKGLSLEEKRNRMLEIFYERKDVFQLKELEKIGPQEKGVISQSVKEVVQSLVDDGYVDSEKIGTSVYFWAFPSKAMLSRKRKIDELEIKLSGIQQKKAETEEAVQKAKTSRSDTSERGDLIQQLTALKSEKEELKKLLEAYRDSDPDLIAQEEQQTKIAFEAANRWTDNIFAVRTWIKNKFNMSEQDVNSQFDIPEGLDYLE